MGAHLLILRDAVVYGADAFYDGETQRHSGVVLLALGGEPIAVKTRTDLATGEAVLVAPGVRRSLQAQRGRYLSIQIEPHHRLYRSLLRLREAGGAFALRAKDLRNTAQLVAACTWGGGAPAELERALVDLADTVEGVLPPKPWKDDRIRMMLGRLAATPPGDYSFKALVRSSRLSASRLSHAFSEDAGLSIRGYMLWRKTREALRLIARRQDLTRIAYEAGFADSSHLARTFRATLGLRPSQLADAQATHARDWAA